MGERVIVVPAGARHGIDIALACVAGALAVLVALTARDALARPAQAPIAPAATASAAPGPTEAPPLPAAQPQTKHGGKGKD